MMGLIFNLALDMIEAKGGAQARTRALERAEQPGRAFKSELVYPEADWQRLAAAAAAVLDVDADTAERGLAEYAVPVLAERFGAFFRASEDAMAFLRRVPKIHLDFPRAMGAQTEEKLAIAADEEKRIVYHYCSPNQLCTFLMAAAERVHQRYGTEQWEIVQTQCMKQGASHCEIVITVT